DTGLELLNDRTTLQSGALKLLDELACFGLPTDTREEFGASRSTEGKVECVAKGFVEREARLHMVDGFRITLATIQDPCNLVVRKGHERLVAKLRADPKLRLIRPKGFVKVSLRIVGAAQQHLSLRHLLTKACALIELNGLLDVTHPVPGPVLT